MTARKDYIASSLPEGLPDVPLDFAQWLVERYPPKCWDPDTTSEHQHHVYRGAADLAALTLLWAQAQSGVGEEPVSGDEDINLSGAEDAQAAI